MKKLIAGGVLLLTSFTASAASLTFTNAPTAGEQDFYYSAGSPPVASTSITVDGIHDGSSVDEDFDFVHYDAAASTVDSTWELTPETDYAIRGDLTIMVDPADLSGTPITGTLSGNGEVINLVFGPVGSDQSLASVFLDLVGGQVYTLALTGSVEADGTPGYPTVQFSAAGLTETPLPAAAWLFGSVLMGAAAWRKRKQAKAA